MKASEFEKIAELLGRQHKISVEEGESWAANIKTRKVYYRKADIYDLPEDNILGLLLHEIAHIHYTTPCDEGTENKELTHNALNMLEDISIEHIISADYPNAGEILNSTKDSVLDTLVRILPKLQASLHEKATLYAAARFEGRGGTHPITEYEKMGEEISKIMIKEKADIYNRKKTSDLLPLTKKIVDMLIQKFGQPTDEEKRKMQQEADAEENPNKDQKTGNTKNKLLKALGGKSYSDQWEDNSSKMNYIDKIAEKANTIGKKLRNILKRNNAMEFGGRFRAGKLLTKRIIRIKTLKDRFPFAKRIIKSNQSYAFAVASDVSGSMFNGRITAADYAMSSMYMVGEALRIAGVPRSLMIFANETIKINEINKLPVRWDDMSNNKIIAKAGGGTELDKAINACTKELKKERAERKIMIILTDGDSSESDLKKAWEETQKEGIECLGIKVGDDSNDTFEKILGEGKVRNVNYKKTEEIETAFIDILKESIKMSEKHYE